MVYHTVDYPYVEVSYSSVLEFLEILHNYFREGVLEDEEIKFILEPLCLYDAYLYWNKTSGLLP